MLDDKKYYSCNAYLISFDPYFISREDEFFKVPFRVNFSILIPSNFNLTPTKNKSIALDRLERAGSNNAFKRLNGFIEFGY